MYIYVYIYISNPMAKAVSGPHELGAQIGQPVVHWILALVTALETQYRYGRHQQTSTHRDSFNVYPIGNF